MKEELFKSHRAGFVSALMSDSMRPSGKEALLYCITELHQLSDEHLKDLEKSYVHALYRKMAHSSDLKAEEQDKISTLMCRLKDETKVGLSQDMVKSYQDRSMSETCAKRLLSVLDTIENRNSKIRAYQNILFPLILWHKELVPLFLNKINQLDLNIDEMQLLFKRQSPKKLLEYGTNIQVNDIEKTQAFLSLQLSYELKALEKKGASNPEAKKIHDELQTIIKSDNPWKEKQKACLQVLHQKSDAYIGKSIQRVCINIALCITGIFILALIAKVLYDVYKQNKQPGFFKSDTAIEVNRLRNAFLGVTPPDEALHHSDLSRQNQNK